MGRMKRRLDWRLLFSEVCLLESYNYCYYSNSEREHLVERSFGVVYRKCTSIILTCSWWLFRHVRVSWVCTTSIVIVHQPPKNNPTAYPTYLTKHFLLNWVFMILLPFNLTLRWNIRRQQILPVSKLHGLCFRCFSFSGISLNLCLQNCLRSSVANVNRMFSCFHMAFNEPGH